MINVGNFIKHLNSLSTDFFTGVPDSVLEHLCNYLHHQLSSANHIIAANEGNAVALATGYHLSTGKVPVVYMQNSGLGNTINPLTSLVNRGTYSIPLLLLIGWRGYPEEKDEPQHLTMGKLTMSILQLLDIPTEVLSADAEIAFRQIERLLRLSIGSSTPVALLVRKNTFEKHLFEIKHNQFELKRYDAIDILLKELADAITVSTTGKCSREVFTYNCHFNDNHDNIFYCVGAMGHASMIAMGLAIHNPERLVCCLDGDGAVLMHMGAMATIGTKKPPNLIHIVLNNGTHESVGGQDTGALEIEFPAVALNCGYKCAYTAIYKEEIIDGLLQIRRQGGPGLLEIKIREGSPENLMRPNKPLHYLKEAFMKKNKNIGPIHSIFQL